jgi:hypothetical protein
MVYMRPVPIPNRCPRRSSVRRRTSVHPIIGRRIWGEKGVKVWVPGTTPHHQISPHAIVGAYWVIFEPITHFKEEFLKAKLGGYWWIVICVLPAPVAGVAAFHHYKHYHWQIWDEFDLRLLMS